jgi:hypothetical protein
MAHFAKIKNNVVTQVIVVSNDVLENKDFPESESIGVEFIQSLGLGANWKQTSYNNNFRGKYAGIGDSYNADLDVFEAAKIQELIVETTEEPIQ